MVSWFININVDDSLQYHRKFSNQVITYPLNYSDVVQIYVLYSSTHGRILWNTSSTFGFFFNNFEETIGHVYYATPVMVAQVERILSLIRIMTAFNLYIVSDRSFYQLCSTITDLSGMAFEMIEVLCAAGVSTLKNSHW
jgi:hypothetical protein